MNETEKRIREILRRAAKDEDLSKGFYEDLTFTEMDEHYVENLLKKEKKIMRRKKKGK